MFTNEMIRETFFYCPTALNRNVNSIEINKETFYVKGTENWSLVVGLLDYF